MRRQLLAIIAILALVSAACGGGSEGGDTTAATTGDTEAPAATDPPATTITAAPDTTTTEAPADEQPGAAGVIPDLNVGQTLMPYADEDITAGSVVIYWYNGTGGTRLAVYTGEGIAAAEGLGLCPGNSINAGGFMHITNAPFEAGACDGASTGAGSLQWCTSGVWIYETAIPNDLDGELWGSLEWRSGDGFKGLTSQFATSADMAEFEYGLDSYAVAPWMTTDGSTVIQCGAPSA